MSWTDVLDTDIGMLPTTRMKISGRFLELSGMFVTIPIYSKSMALVHISTIDLSCPTDRSKRIDRYIQQPVPVALHPLASRSAEPVS